MDFNERVQNILVEQLSPSWKRFAHITLISGFYNIVEQIDKKNDNDQSKLELFLQILSAINQSSYNEVIANSLYTLGRYDILWGIALYKNFEKVQTILIKDFSADWIKLARGTCLNGIDAVVEQIEQDYEDDKAKMASLLKKIFEMEPLQYKKIIGNCLSSIGKVDILFGVALDRSFETVRDILVEIVSPDWKKLANNTCLHDVDCIEEQIDQGFSNDKLKMNAFLKRLYESKPLTCKKLIANFLNAASRYDVLFRLGLVECSELIIKLLLEYTSADWKKFAIYTCLHEVNCIIQVIDLENDDNQMKMTAVVKKLNDINPLQFKELIENCLVTLRKFSVLSAFDKQGHFEEETIKKDESVIIKVSEHIEKDKVLIEQLSPDWRRFAFNTYLNNVYSIVEQIDKENDDNELKMAAFLQKLHEINPLGYKEVIANSLYNLRRFDILLEIEMDENFKKVYNILVERVSTDWKRFARETNLKDVDAIVEHIDDENKDDLSKMSSFLEKLIETCPHEYKVIISNTLTALGRVDVLVGMTLGENYETLRQVLIERVSPDWRRFARHTCVPDIDSIIVQIDNDCKDDQSKMASFLDKLYEIRPVDYINLIEVSLNTANRLDVCLAVALDEHFESLKKILLERLSSDWKMFAYLTSLYEVHYTIEHIDHDYDNDQLKLMAFLKKLFEFEPINYKGIIKNSLIASKRYSVLHLFEEENAEEEEEKLLVQTKGINHPSTLSTKNSKAGCLSDMGKYNEALEIYYQVVKTQADVNHRAALDTKVYKASCFKEKKKYDKALEIYYQIDKIQTDAHGINHPSSLDSKYHIASCLQEMFNYNRTFKLDYYADKLRADILTINQPPTLNAISKIASCLKEITCYNEALEIYYHIDKIQTGFHGINHPSSLDLKYQIASCLQDMFNYDSALKIDNHIDKLRADILKINQPSTLKVIHDIASCLKNMRKYDETLEIYYHIDKIQTDVHGINHPSSLDSKYHIASCLQEMFNYDRTLKIDNHIDKLRADILVINPPPTSDAISDIASCLKNIRKYDKALEIYYHIDKIQTDVHGINHPSSLDSKYHIASCLQDMFNYDRTLKIDNHIDKLQADILTVNQPSTSKVIRDIASCLKNMRKYDKALEIYYHIDKIQTDVHGINHPSSLDSKYHIASCLQDMFNYDRTLIIDNHIDKLRADLLTVNQPSTPNVMRDIASCLKRMRKYDKALEIYYHIDKIQTDAHGVNHPLSSNLKFHIADCLKEKKRYEEA